MRKISNCGWNNNQKTFVVFAGLLALAAGVPIPDDVVAVPALIAAPAAVPTFNLAPTLIRAPAHDSASIEHHRLGGNFAYAVAEAHAYAQVTPQVSTITHPVAETTFVHEPATIARVVPGAVTTVNHIPHPIIEHQPILAQEPIVQAKTTYHQPLYKTQTVTHHVAQPLAHVAAYAAPVAAPVAAPAVYGDYIAQHGAPAHFAAHNAGFGYAGFGHAAPAAYAGYGNAGYGYGGNHFGYAGNHFGYAGYPHGYPHQAIAPIAAEE